MTELYDTAETEIVTSAGTVVLPPVPVVAGKTKMQIFGKVAALVCGILLSAAVLIAFWSIVSERTTASDEALCRARASVEVNAASAEKQVALARHSVLVGRFIVLVIDGDREDPNYITELQTLSTDLQAADVRLTAAGDALESAVEAQVVALEACSAS